MWQNDTLIIKYIMLASMTNVLQRQHESMDTQSIVLNLKELYGEQSLTTRYEISDGIRGAQQKQNFKNFKKL